MLGSDRIRDRFICCRLERLEAESRNDPTPPLEGEISLEEFELA